MKKFLLPFQNMVRDDLFSGSLAVWNALGFAFHFARPPIPSRALRGEDIIPFELFQEYTANWNFARKKAQPCRAVPPPPPRFLKAFFSSKQKMLDHRVELKEKIREIEDKGVSWLEPARAWVKSLNQADKLLSSIS